MKLNINCWKIPYMVFFLLLGCLGAYAQQGGTVKGVVFDDKGETIIGASVMVKGYNTMGTITDVDGNFTLRVPDENSTLVVSYIGYKTHELKAAFNTILNVTLEDEASELSEVVVVGYGQQKKASVVGAITQTTGKVLERAAGINDIGAALTGNLPGVITTQSSGMPGEEEPKIVIRGASSWNGSDPLVLVDGIERPMSSVDISSVQSLSVLKDASATAVYGVKGANGVILITTKRGQEGSAKIDVGFTATMKFASKLPDKFDSYDALMARNQAIEHELDIYPDSWSDMTPQDIIEKYRYPANITEKERYPNVDWQKELFRDYAMSYNANINLAGGTKFVKYFTAVDYVHEGDLFREWDNGRNYKTGFGYNRINVRSNLDFQLTKTTLFKLNISGSNSNKKSPWVRNTWAIYDSSDWASAQVWSGVYNIAPNLFLPKYSDGSWGYYPINSSQVSNSARNLATAGSMTTTNTRINTDFTLEQNLDFLTKGLSARAMISWDNLFMETHRGINDLDSAPILTYIDPATGQVTHRSDLSSESKFDYMPGVRWGTGNGIVQNGKTQRHLNYQGQLNWTRSFGQHGVSATGVFSRQEDAYGNEIARYREDWVARATYNFAERYFFEYNGAYNGSEKFDSKFRFGFFNSGAIGWMLSEESFMKSLKEAKILDMMKVRASYGEIGDDSSNYRFLYMTQWEIADEKATLDLNNKAGSSPYSIYRESTIGNKDVHWEKVTKMNLGVDYSFLDGLLAGSLEFFKDKRTDILVAGAERSVPSYLGVTPATANLGEAETKGYELELRISKTFANKLHVWANLSKTHAKNKIIHKDDADLLPEYQKLAGHSIGQTTSFVDGGYMNTVDQVLGSPMHDINNSQKLPGDYYIVDFNGDGVVDSNDRVPYGYSSVPQNTYNATIGFEWKGVSAFAQFYGVNNVTREVTLKSFSGNIDTVYDLGDWWSADKGTGDETVPRWKSSTSPYSAGTQYLYDASYIRLKNVEVAYTWNKGWIKKVGIDMLKLYVNGNNLWIWSKMPDDRESNYAGSGGQGAYPTMKRLNFGLKFTL